MIFNSLTIFIRTVCISWTNTELCDINILTPQQVLSGLVFNYDIMHEAFYSMHFRTAIISLIFQINAHGQLNICIV